MEYIATTIILMLISFALGYAAHKSNVMLDKKMSPKSVFDDTIHDDDDDDDYVLIEWPDVQELFDIEGFDDNSCLGNESAFFVNKKWLKENHPSKPL